jgi:type II secretory ATPase GspE/PulE/Tfp pilus assembly ATPase PilB-like protein
MYILKNEVAASLKLDTAKIGKLRFYKGKGCERCFNSGYSGRTVIAEVLQLSPKIRELILSSSQEQFIKQQARLEGMKTLREDGLAAALEGQTTIEEVLRVTAPDE